MLANQVYNEYIQDRHHLHMNATRWVSLSEFVKHLGRTGVARVEDSELGWYIQWIDNSPSARARQDAIRKMDRNKMDDEQRSRKLLDEQIRRATAQSGTDESTHKIEERRGEGIVRSKEQEPVKLSLSKAKLAAPEDAAQDTNPDTSAASASLPTSAPAQPAPAAFKMRMNPLKAPGGARGARNPLAGPPKSSEDSGGFRFVPAPPPTHLGAAERIIMEEQRAREARSGHGSPAPGARGPGAAPVMQPGVKRSRF